MPVTRRRLYKRRPVKKIIKRTNIKYKTRTKRTKSTAAIDKRVTYLMRQMKYQKQTLMYRRNINGSDGTGNSLQQVNLWPITEGPTLWTRIFSGADDVQPADQAYLRKIVFDWKIQLNLNTEQGIGPLYMTMFIVRPRWKTRLLVGSTTSTILAIGDLQNGVHYSNSSIPSAFPLLNLEFFEVLARRRKTLIPPLTNILGATTIDQTNGYYSHWKQTMNLYPRHWIKSQRGKWSDVTNDDIYYSKQIYALLFVQTANTSDGQGGRYLSWERSMTYILDQVKK